MRICHVTPHLPPDQAANALLPVHLGRWAKDAGHDVVFISHPPLNETHVDEASLPGRVVTIPRRAKGPAILRRLQSVMDARRISQQTREALDAADIVHVHSNGLLTETCAVLAARHRKPVVMTLYGTEIWHYRPKRAIDLFTRAYHASSWVTFYSQALRERAQELGLDHPRTAVVYPPVANEFRPIAPDERERVRGSLGAHDGPLIINVKRLHPLGGHADLIEAMTQIAKAIPSIRLVICGTGGLREDLEARVRERALTNHIAFAGLVDNASIAGYDAAADLFVLPSLLEACPTVALEALACGTPVVSTDNPGGVELQKHFGDDVRVVPRQKPEALAAAVVDALKSRRRVLPATIDRINRDFRIASVAGRYLEIYRKA